MNMRLPVMSGRAAGPPGTRELARAVAAWLGLWMALAILSAASAPAAEGAQDQKPASLMDLEVEELAKVKIASVTGASRYEQQVIEAPSSVSIVTADEIRKYGYRTLADILRSVRGFDVTYDRNYSYSGIRGFNRPGDFNSRILLMINGHRINDTIYDQAPVGAEFPFDVDLIERVEIIRGPSSSLYGSNAFFGVINVITRTGRDVKSAEIAASGGGQNTYTGRISIGEAFKGGPEVLLSASDYRSDGQRRLYYKEFDTPATNNGVAENRDADGASTYFSRISFSDFTLDSGYGKREKDIPTGSYGTVFNDPTNRAIDEHGWLDLKYAHPVGNNIDFAARVYYDEYHYYGYYMYDYPPLTLNRDESNGRWWGSDVQVITKLSEQNKLTAGAEFRQDYHQAEMNYDVDPYVLYTDIEQRSTLWALYLEDEYRILPTLILNAGVRYDHYTTFGGTTNPRFALIYRPRETTIFKLLYGEAFRAPSVREREATDLQPETIDTYELVYEQYLGNNLRSSLSGFYYRINGLISQQWDPAQNASLFKNYDTIEAKGVEAELEGKWSNGARGRISYTLQQARDTRTGQTLTNSPQRLAKLNLIVPLVSDRATAGAEVQYTSRSKTLAGTYANAYTVANLTLFSWNVAKGLEVSASVYNLFDKIYGNPGWGEHLQDIIEQDGRTLRVKATYRF